MNRILKYIIVEDNKLEELHLYSLLLKYKTLQFVGKAATMSDAIALVDAVTPDIVFMDVKIKGGSGLDIARLLKGKIMITIFVSSYSEFAIDGFELYALDYLLKPVTAQRLDITHERIMEYASMKELERARMLYAQKESIFIKISDKEIELKARDIAYLEAMQDYTKVITVTDKYLVNMVLRRFLELQVPNVFIQIHRRYAVVQNNIKTVADNKVICNHCVLPVGIAFIADINKIKV